MPKKKLRKPTTKTHRKARDRAANLAKTNAARAQRIAAVQDLIDTLEVNHDQLGEFLGFTGNRVQQLVREGVIPKRSNGRYPLKDCVTAYVDHLKSDVRSASKERGDLARVQKEYKQFMLAREQGLFIPSHEVSALFCAIVSNAKARLLVFAARVKTRCPMLPDQAIREADAVAREALEELSSDQFPSRIRAAVERGHKALGTAAEH